MASFGNVYNMGFILLASMAVVALGDVIEEEVGSISPAVSPAPSNIEYDVPDTEYIPPYYKYLRGCVENVPKGCGPQIFDYLFKERKTISSHCCHNMGSIGVDCHKALTAYVASIPEFTGKEVHILSKAKGMLKKCPT